MFLNIEVVKTTKDTVRLIVVVNVVYSLLNCTYQSHEHISLHKKKHQGFDGVLTRSFFPPSDYGHKILSSAGLWSSCPLRSLGHVVDVVLFEVA